jgi:hypothetical protein
MMLFVASLTCHVVQAESNPPGLFSHAKSRKAVPVPKDLPKNVDEVSSTYAQANIGMLFNGDWKKPKTKAQLPEVRFDLSPTESVIGVVNYTEHYADAGIGYWEGTLKGEEKGTFSVNVSKIGVISSIRSEKKGTFEINCNAAFECKLSKLKLTKPAK